MLAHLRSSRPRISGAVRVWCLTGVLVVTASALLLMTADSIPAPLGRIHVPWWMLAAGFAVTEVFVLDVGRSGNERWVSLSEVPLVIGLVFSTPATIVAAQALGVGVVLVLYRRQNPLRCAFNVAQRATTTLVAVFVFVPIIQLAGSTWPIVWLAAFAATLSADLVGGILTNAANALSDSARMRFDHVVGMGTALTFAKTGLALVAVMVMTQYPAGLVVVAIPVAAAFLAGRAHVKVRRERDDMVLLQRATGLAQRSLHPDEMLPLLLQHLRDMFHADIAELVLPDQKAKDHLASRVGPGGAVAILEPIDLDPTQGVWARVTAEGEGVLLARPIHNPLLAEHFNSLGIHDAIVVPVSYEDGPPAILSVANRIGDLTTFGSDDLHLLEALAKHIGVTIRNSRLTLRLEEALEREAETNKLKEDFLATISHELRSPLTSMHGYVKTMRDAGDGMTEKEREEFLAAADRAGERLHSLIEDLLFTSVETPVSSDRLSPVGLAGLVGRVVEDRLEQLEPGRIVLRFPPSQPPVWTNEGETKRIVSNLLDNALKYSPADTPVTISAETDGAGVRVSFHNLGDKIPESERERIFDRFYQIEHGLTRSNGGIGLGLHICRRTAESLGGRVWLNESDESGSVFCVWLPSRDVESNDGHDGRRGRAHQRLAHASAGEA